MKTSNKILLGILVVIFTIPFLLAYSLRNKIDKGQFTYKKDKGSNTNNFRSGSFTQFKVVVVSAPDPSLLKCHLKLADTMSYNYYKGDSKDSVVVFTTKDTLYIRYRIRSGKSGEDEDSDRNNFEVNVSLPPFTNLVVDGSVVLMDLGASPANSFSLTLKNKGVIRDVSANSKKDNATMKAEPGNKAVHRTAEVPPKLSSDLTLNNPKSKPAQESGTGNTQVDIKHQVIFGMLYRG